LDFANHEIEQNSIELTLNQQVPGSSPGRRTKKAQYLKGLWRFDGRWRRVTYEAHPVRVR
jgi:hypothetical protein